MNIPFVYTSTGSVYQRSNIPIREDFPFIGESETNAYSSSKLFADQYLSNLKDFEKITIVRPFFIFGKGAKQPALFPSLIHAINTGETVRLRGKNGMLFNPIDSQDAARAVLHLVERKKFGIYNLGGIEEVNLRRVCEIIGSFFEKGVLFSVDNGESRVVSSQAKLLSTGFQYKDNFEENFQKYLSEAVKD
jgi:nucleoside-diphosphate-sugar epimerase